MAVGPDHGHSVVTFFFDSGRVYLGVDFFLFDYHCPAEFVDAGCTFARNSHRVGVHSLLHSFVLHDHLPFCSVVEDEHSFWALFFEGGRQVAAKSSVNVRQRVAFGQDQGDRSSVIGVSRDFAQERNLGGVLNKEGSTSMPNWSISIWV
jgi:hypothetical protein